MQNNVVNIAMVHVPLRPSLIRISSSSSLKWMDNVPEILQAKVLRPWKVCTIQVVVRRRGVPFDPLIVVKQVQPLKCGFWQRDRATPTAPTAPT